MQLANRCIRDWCTSQIDDGGPVEVAGIKVSSRTYSMPHRRRSTGTTPSW